MSNDGAQQRPGRRVAKEIVTRRLQALEYLEEKWPLAADLLDKVYYGDVPADEISDLISALVASKAKSERKLASPVPDAAPVNPEQAMAEVLETLGVIAAEREDCNSLHRDLTVALALLEARRQQLDALRDAQNKTMMAALASRPSIDREVYKRALKMVRGGATRYNGVRHQQDADVRWFKRCDWTSLGPTEGVLTFVELPGDGHREAAELLPPADDISAYVLDPAAEEQMVKKLDDAKLRTWYIKQIQGWLAAHYPKHPPLLRQDHIIARAWYVLVMRKHHLVQTDELKGRIFLPSPWSRGKVIEVIRSA